MASVVDIFCGAGGLTRGFLDEGFRVVAGIDSDDSCCYAYTHNNEGVNFIHAKLEDVSDQYINELFPEEDIKILVGCAPCQPFSKYGRRYKSNTFDGKWHLVRTFAERIVSIRPQIVSMENVPDLKKQPIYKEFKKTLKDAGYKIFDAVVYAPDYGVPQSRKRLILLASLLGEIELIHPTHKPENYPTVEQVIGELPPLQAGEIHSQDPMHRAQGLENINKLRIQQSLPGGSWKDWDTDLISPCHQREKGRSYKNVYGRMKPDEPAPTMTTQAFSYGSGRFGHYDMSQNRALSLREIAILQTFPPEYQFIDPEGGFSFEKIGRHLGNAVPVRLAQVIAKSIQEHLNKHSS